MERVRKSSAGMEGAVKLEKDLAADLSASRDAVKLDLKVDVRVDGEDRREVGRLGTGVDSVGDVSLSSSSDLGKCNRGWSSSQDCDSGDKNDFALRSNSLALLIPSGVDGLLEENTEVSSALKDGIESLEAER